MLNFTPDQWIIVLLVFVLVFAWPRIRATLARRRTLKDDPYYAIGRRASWTIGVLYVALGLLLIGMYWLTRDAFSRPM